METAKQNIAALPAQCFGMRESDNSIIRINAGEMIYKKIPQPIEMLKLKKEEIFKKTRIIPTKKEVVNALVNDLNTSAGVTTHQRKAMEFGSLFGWKSKAAYPKHWENVESTLNKSVSNNA